jgi:farnesyl-diphosphate farnesyltransferase
MRELRDAELMEVLTGVSRSFVLTIRALPRGLRRPVGLAYLLARASDTMADTVSAPLDARVACLREFAGRVAGEEGKGMARLKEIAPENAAERYLLENLDRVVAAAEGLPAGDREEIVGLMRKITRGQELDLVRFSDSGRLVALQTGAELDEYTYLVAGCVGEFWTRICGAYVRGYGRVGIEELCALGRGFGQGLQLVNILRDLPGDVREGRCYLPMAELRAVGIMDPEELRRDLRRAAPVYEAWRKTALDHLAQGRRYIEAIRPWRIRFACLLPWALGVRTLRMIGEKSPLETGERVKVPRSAMGGMVRRAAWAAVVGRISD